MSTGSFMPAAQAAPLLVQVLQQRLAAGVYTPSTPPDIQSAPYISCPDTLGELGRSATYHHAFSASMDVFKDKEDVSYHKRNRDIVQDARIQGLLCHGVRFPDQHFRKRIKSITAFQPRYHRSIGWATKEEGIGETQVKELHEVMFNPLFKLITELDSGALDVSSVDQWPKTPQTKKTPKKHNKTAPRQYSDQDSSSVPAMVTGNANGLVKDSEKENGSGVHSPPMISKISRTPPSLPKSEQLSKKLRVGWDGSPSRGPLHRINAANSTCKASLQEHNLEAVGDYTTYSTVNKAVETGEDGENDAKTELARETDSDETWVDSTGHKYLLKDKKELVLTDALIDAEHEANGGMVGNLQDNDTEEKQGDTAEVARGTQADGVAEVIDGIACSTQLEDDDSEDEQQASATEAAESGVGTDDESQVDEGMAADGVSRDEEENGQAIADMLGRPHSIAERVRLLSAFGRWESKDDESDWAFMSDPVVVADLKLVCNHVASESPTSTSTNGSTSGKRTQEVEVEVFEIEDWRMALRIIGDLVKARAQSRDGYLFCLMLLDQELTVSLYSPSCVLAGLTYDEYEAQLSVQCGTIMEANPRPECSEDVARQSQLFQEFENELDNLPFAESDGYEKSDDAGQGEATDFANEDEGSNDENTSAHGLACSSHHGPDDANVVQSTPSGSAGNLVAAAVIETDGRDTEYLFGGRYRGNIFDRILRRDTS